MQERYKRIQALSPMMYEDDAPIIIEAGALLLDTAYNRILAQLKIRSLSEKKIIAIYVRLKAYDIGNEFLGEIKYQYLDLNLNRDMDYGSKNPIDISFSTTRKVKICVEKVFFSDDSIWESNQKDWEPLQPRERLNYYNANLLRIYQEHYGNDKVYKTENVGPIWYCGCGCINKTGEHKCYSCESLYDELVEGLDRKQLQFWYDVEVEQKRKALMLEEEALEKKRKKAIKEKKRRIAIVKKAMIIAAIATIITGGIAIFLYKQHMAKKADIPYQEACSYYEDELYQEAYEAFMRLGDYKDSKEKAKELVGLLYSEAVKCIERNEVDKADEMLTYVLRIDEVDEIIGEDNCLEARNYKKYFWVLSQIENFDSGEKISIKTVIGRIKNLEGFNDVDDLFETNELLRSAVLLNGTWKAPSYGNQVWKIEDGVVYLDNDQTNLYIINNEIHYDRNTIYDVTENTFKRSNSLSYIEFKRVK